MINYKQFCTSLLNSLEGLYGVGHVPEEVQTLMTREREALAQTDPEEPTDDESFLVSMAHCMAVHSRDWGLDHRDAWLYGIVCGWGDALQGVAERHSWDEATVERLQRLRAATIAQQGELT